MKAGEFRQRFARDVSEKEFQALVVDVAKRRGWLVYHTFDSRRSGAGFPDLVLVRERVLFRELKTARGVVSAVQKAWLQRLVSAGADVAVWRPADWVDGSISEALR